MMYAGCRWLPAALGPVRPTHRLLVEGLRHLGVPQAVQGLLQQADVLHTVDEPLGANPGGHVGGHGGCWCRVWLQVSSCGLLWSRAGRPSDAAEPKRQSSTALDHSYIVCADAS
jgi:hypothetical protein